MKNYYLSLILIFISSVTFSQETWEELEPHNAKTIDRIQVSNEGYIIGRLENPDILIISKDQGKTWEDFYVFPSKTVNPKLKQDSNNEFYLSSYGGPLYKYNSTDQVWSLLIDDRSINDYGFLSNGNIITTGASLKIYNPQGDLISSHEHGRSYDQVLIGENDVHYTIENVGYKYYSYMFNSDLTVFSEEFVSEVSYKTQQFHYLNDRIFSKYAYSDDGKVWTPYNDDLFGVIENFILEPYPGFGGGLLDQYFPAANGEVLIYDDHLGCVPSSVYISSNNRTQWTEINIALGTAYADNLEVASQENIFIASCVDRYDFITNSTSVGYQPFDIEGFSFSPIGFEFYSFANGRIITDKGYYSDDEGMTWEIADLYIQGISYLVVKDDIVHIVSQYEVYQSSDYGETWKRFELMEYPNFNNLYLRSDISASGHIYYPTASNDTLVKTTFAKEIVSETPIEEGGNILSIITSYYGDEVYLLTRRDGKLYLDYSLDGGTSFAEKEIIFSSNPASQLHNDNFGNLYFMSERDLFMSQDKGQTWKNITPIKSNDLMLKDIDVGHDYHIYLATQNSPILKSPFKVNESLSAVDNLEGEKILVYPNPASEFIHVDYSGSTELSRYEIYNSAGQRVMSGNETLKRGISVNGLSSGIYLIKVFTSEDLSITSLVTIVD